MTVRALLIGCAIVLTFGMWGCGGGGAEIKSEISTTTKGQQLLDLKKALDSEAINQEEYERERQLLLKAK